MSISCTTDQAQTATATSQPSRLAAIAASPAIPALRVRTAAADTDCNTVTAAATAIARLRRRLACLSTLEHPAVTRELRKLEQQLAGQLDASGRAPGRHRLPGEPERANGDQSPQNAPDSPTPRS
jgi:hypothetical protein